MKTPKKPRRIEEHTVLILDCDGTLALQKRPAKGLLAGLWEFPNFDGHLPVEQVIAILEQMGITVTEVVRQSEKTHIFTHVEWNMRGYYLRVKAPAGSYVWMDRQTVTAQAALPTAFRIFFE